MSLVEIDLRTRLREIYNSIIDTPQGEIKKFISEHYKFDETTDTIRNKDDTFLGFDDILKVCIYGGFPKYLKGAVYDQLGGFEELQETIRHSFGLKQEGNSFDDADFPLHVIQMLWSVTND
jgi:hypothetical protein